MSECVMPHHRRQTREAAEHHVRQGLPSYFIARCSHFGDLGVVETRNLDSGFVCVDYVQWEPSLDVENHTFFLDRDDTEADVQAEWDQLNRRMLAGDAPDRERSS